MGGDIEAQDDGGATPLHWACLAGSTALVSLLSTYGGHLHARDNYGRTALHFAAYDKGLLRT